MAVKKNVRIRSSKVIAEDAVMQDDVMDEVVEDVEDAVVEVDPAATELLFEAEDVAELLAEVTGQDVDVTVNDDDTVDFGVGDDVYTVSAEGDEELLEASTRVLKKSVSASTATKVGAKVGAPAARKAVRRVR